VPEDNCYDALIVDVDGVVWRDGEPIPENVEALRRLIREGARIVFLTNNSTKSRRLYAEKLSQAINARISVDSIVNSGYSAAAWLARTRGPTRVLPIGEEGLIDELVGAGHTPLTSHDWPLAEAVVVGLDRNLSYRKLAAAHKAILRGALFVATNQDNAYPVPGGTEPGAGSLVALLSTSTGRRPDFDAGKPGEWILRLALEAAGSPRRPLIVGDRLDTDIEMARRAGVPGLLVRTGVHRDAGPGPGYTVVDNLLVALEEGLVRACGRG